MKTCETCGLYGSKYFNCEKCKDYSEYEIKNCDSCKKFNTYFDCSQCKDFDEWEQKFSLVDHPKHYVQGKYEVIDIILEAVKDLPPQQAVCVANIIKYILRYHYKNGLQDVKKAQWYMNKLINIMEVK